MLLRNERGIILVISLMVLLAMTALGMMVFYSSAVDFKMAGNERASKVAYYAAQAGLLDAKKRLEENTDDTTGYAAYGEPDESGNVPAGSHLLDPDWQSGTINGTLPNGATYSVIITHKGREEGGSWVVHRGDETDHWPYYRVTSVGYYLDTSKMLEELVYLDVTATWTKAVIACSNLEVQNNAGTDSFDSDAGDVYNSASAGTEGDIVVAGNVFLDNGSGFNGSISATGYMELKNNSKVNGGLTANGTILLGSGVEILGGNIVSGSTATPAITIGANPTITNSVITEGSILDLGNDVDDAQEFPWDTVAPIESPEACDPEKWLDVKASKLNNNNAAMSRTYPGSSNATCDDFWAECKAGGCCKFCPSDVIVTLPGGDAANPERYYFESLGTYNRAKMITTGFVEIYINGDLTIANNNTFCGNVLEAECCVDTNPDCPDEWPDSPAAEVLLYAFGMSRDAGCNTLDTYTTVTVSQNAEVFAKIYAPEASQTIIDNNSNVYGAVVAGGMCAGCGGGGGVDNNAMVHYDAAIANTSTRNASAYTEYRKECYYGRLINNTPSGQEYYATGSCRLTPP